MAIDFYCTHCGKRLRVASEDAGKLADCPMCGGVCHVPTSVQFATTNEPAGATANDDTVRENFTRRFVVPPVDAADEVTHSRIFVDDTLSRAWGLFRSQSGSLVGIAVTHYAVIGALCLTYYGIDALVAPATGWIGATIRGVMQLTLAFVTLLLFTIWLTASLKVARGQEVTLRNSLPQRRHVVCMVPAATIYVVGVAAGLVCFVIPGLLAGLTFLPFGWFLVDRSESIADAFTSARQMTAGNMQAMFGLVAISLLLTVFSVVTFLLGGLIGVPLVALIHCVAYLRATGQPLAVPRF